MSAETEYWDTVGVEEMGGTTDTTDSHLSKIINESPLGKYGVVPSVMEIGCGMGRLLAPLSKRYPNALFTGFDPSQPLLNRIGEVGSNVRVTTALPGMYFNYIYSMLVFQHIDTGEKRKHIEWAHSHLQPDGLFRFQFVEGDYDHSNNHQCRSTDLYRWCMVTGFTYVDIYEDADHPEWRWVDAQ